MKPVNKIPQNFLWGSSISAFQAEGAWDINGKGPSVPDVLSQKNSKEYADTTVASDFYHHFVDDINLMAEAGLRSFRFSINWTRIYPNGDDKQPCREGIKFYHKMLDALIKNGIEPIATLYHFDLPWGLMEKYRGWESRECIEDYLRFARTCFDEFGGKIKFWLTINEQNLLIRKDKMMFPLGISDEIKEKARHQINHHMFLANARAIKLCRALLPHTQIGPTIAWLPSYPASPRPEDVIAAQYADNLYNFYMTDIYNNGMYPTYYTAYLEEKGWLPDISEEDKSTLRDAKPDFLAFNYYVTFCAEMCPEDEESDYVSILKLSIPGKFRYVKNPWLDATEYGWQIDPVGFRKSMVDLYSRYGLPLMITENGIGTHDEISEDNTVHDDYRINYLRTHLAEMKKAIAEGVNILSYNCWTFIDVVSSGNGFSKRYGLVYIDRSELEARELRRVKKDSFYFYQEVIKSNGANL